MVGNQLVINVLHQFDFYHITKGDYINPAILISEKVLKNSDKLLILAPKDKLAYLSDKLWGEKKDSFIAHGWSNDALSDVVSIWLSSDAEDNPIEADMLMLTNGQSLDNAADFKRVFILFDGSSKKELDLARSQWHGWSSKAKHVCRYFTQTPSGSWQQRK